MLPGSLNLRSFISALQRWHVQPRRQLLRGRGRQPVLSLAVSVAALVLPSLFQSPNLQRARWPVWTRIACAVPLSHTVWDHEPSSLQVARRGPWQHRPAHRACVRCQSPLLPCLPGCTTAASWSTQGGAGPSVTLHATRGCTGAPRSTHSATARRRRCLLVPLAFSACPPPSPQTRWATQPRAAGTSGTAAMTSNCFITDSPGFARPMLRAGVVQCSGFGRIGMLRALGRTWGGVALCRMASPHRQTCFSGSSGHVLLCISDASHVSRA